MRVARIALLIGTVTMTAWIGTAPAQATPSNDRLHNATVIASLPTVITEDTSDATSDGPHFCTHGNKSSVFFRFTPAVDETLQADTFGSNYDTVLKVFTGTRGDYQLIRCNDDFVRLESALSFNASAGTTYYFMVQTCCRGSADNEGGALEFGLSAAPTVEPTAAVTVDGARLTSGHKVAVSGTLTCSQRVGVDLFVTVRQVRNDLYLARGSANTAVGCNSGDVTSWQIRVDTKTSVIFGPGQATIRGRFFAADTAGDVSAPIERMQVTIG